MEQGKKFEFSPTLRTLGNHFCQAFGKDGLEINVSRGC